jgi:outer membrane protein TolC
MNAGKGISVLVVLVSSAAVLSHGQNTSPTPRHITLEEAIQLALRHNHTVRIAADQIEEKKYAKDVARSEYFPSVTNESLIAHLTDTQFIQIGAGELGTVANAQIPDKPLVLNQGEKTIATSGTELVEPLTQLLTRVRPANDAAQADLNASRANAQETKNEVALKVHEIYYNVLIAQLHLSAAQAKIQADQDLESERVQQVKFGSALDEQLIDSRAQSLEAKQDLLTTQLQISDLTMQLDDVMGLPVTTQLVLDTTIPSVSDACERDECIKTALASHPEIVAARAEVEKASAGVRSGKADYIPDISAFARYSYQSDVPFLARNFGTFGARLTYDLFDGGRRSAAVKESEAQLAQAKENLARVTEAVELSVDTALNRLDRTKEMVDVSQQVLALRAESTRVSAQQLVEGEALQSQADAAAAQELDAKALLLQSQLAYVQAHDELLQAMGLTPQ